MKEGRALNNASEDLRPKKLGRYLSVVMGVASKVLGCVNLPIEMTSAFGIECNFFFSGSMIASTLADLAKVGRMTSFQSPMMLRSDEGLKLDDDR